MGIAEPVGDSAAEIFEELDLNLRMGLAEILEIFQGEQVAGDLGICDDHGRARCPLNNRHFTKSHSRRESGQPLACCRGGEHEEDAHVTTRQKEHLASDVARLDNDLASLIALALEKWEQFS